MNEHALAGTEKIKCAGKGDCQFYNLILRSHFIRNGVSKDAPEDSKTTGSPFETHRSAMLLRVRGRA